jgi:hypothetical protein
MRSIGLFAAALSLVTAAAACSPSSGSPSPAPDAGSPEAGASADADVADGGDGGDAEVVSCQTDPMAMTYSANLKLAGKLFDYVLVSAMPAPPFRGTNTWTFKVTDTSGALAPNAALSSVYPFMPQHGHPSPLTPTFMKNADGTFEIDSLYFFMPGLWQVTITVAPDAATNCANDMTKCDTAVYTFCVDG